MAAAEGALLEADAGVFDAGDNAVGADADEGDDGGAPAFDFGLEALAAGAKFVVCEFIGSRGGAFDVSPSGARLPAGMTLAPEGILSVGTAIVGSVAGVVFTYSSP